MSIEFTPEKVAEARQALEALLDSTDPSALNGVNAQRLVTNLTRLLKALSPEERQQILAIDGVAGFSIDTLKRCEQAVVLLNDTVSRLSAAKVQTKEAQVPMDLVKEAYAHRARLSKLLDFYLEDDAEAVIELASIRQGTGYDDLVNDLFRLANLAESRQAALANERRFTAQTVPDTRDLAARFMAALSDDETDDAARILDEQRRLYTLIKDNYAELAAAARFALRDAPIGDGFSSLRAISMR